MTARRVSGLLLEGESLLLARALVRIAVQSLRERDAVSALSPAVVELDRDLARAVAHLRSDDQDRPMSPPPCPQGHADMPGAADRSESVPVGSTSPRREVSRVISPGSAGLTTSQAAELLRVSPRQVRRLRVELGGLYRGKDLIFDRSLVEAYATARANRTYNDY